MCRTVCRNSPRVPYISRVAGLGKSLSAAWHLEAKRNTLAKFDDKSLVQDGVLPLTEPVPRHTVWGGGLLQALRRRGPQVQSSVDETERLRPDLSSRQSY